MSEAKTLLQMAGVTPKPGAADDSVLVMIDCQLEYSDGSLHLPGVEAALDEGARLLELARNAGVPVIHVRQGGRPGGLFDPAGEFHALCPAVAPREGEAVVDKALPNSFAGTDLDDRIKNLGRKHLIVAGFMTHMCVSSTVRSAIDYSYGCTVVAGACAARDLPDHTGGVVVAADLHRAALAALADRFAAIVSDAGELESAWAADA